jgi:PDZ domain
VGHHRHGSDAGTGERAPNTGVLGSGRPWKRFIGFAAGAMALAGLLAAGTLTHFRAHPGRIAADQSLMRMQRMGPPPNLQAFYEQLNSGTAAIRDPTTGRVVATGIYAASSLELAHLPSFSSFLPRGLKRVLALGASYNYSALFIAPLRYIRTRTVRVDTSAMQLQGTVIRTNKVLGLAAITATVNQNQASALDPAPPLLNYPLTTTPLRLLIMRRNPDLHQRSAGFALTSGSLQAEQSWCDTSVSGGDLGEPLAYASPSGEFFLAGLAMPSPAPGRCSILGAWNIGEFVATLDQPSPPKSGRMVAFLGVGVESTGVARANGVYRGRQRGAYVTSVQQGSPADMVGLQTGDIIIMIGSKRVGSLAALRAAIHGLRPDSTHTVAFVSDGTVHTPLVLFAAVPASDESG